MMIDGQVLAPARADMIASFDYLVDRGAETSAAGTGMLNLIASFLIASFYLVDSAGGCGIYCYSASASRPDSSVSFRVRDFVKLTLIQTQIIV
jgi:hypothetical protein